MAICRRLTIPRPPGQSARVNASWTFIRSFPTGRRARRHTEATYNWTGHQRTVPIQCGISQVLKIGSQPIRITARAEYWPVRPGGAPVWGARFIQTSCFRSDRFKGIWNLAAALGCPLHVDTRRRPCANRSHSLTTWRILTPLVPALSFWVQWKFRVFVLRMSMCK